MENEFKSVMGTRTDAELIEIVTELKNDYQPDAVIAAQEEIIIRNLTPDKVKKAEEKEKQEEKKAEIESRNKDNTNVPLQIYWKIITLISPGLFNLLIGENYKKEGFERRYKEMWRWTFYGLGFYIFLFFLFLLMSSI
ncbi:MAG: hypothetical protein ABIJ97_11755 [Bacteroidota bacterium]